MLATAQDVITRLSVFYRLLDSQIACEFTLAQAVTRISVIAETYYDEAARMARAVRLGAWGEGEIPTYSEMVAQEEAARRRAARSRRWVQRVLSAHAEAARKGEL